MLIVKEPAVVEGAAFSGEAQIFRLVVINASHDVIRQDSLFLLPPGLAVVPNTAIVLFAVLQGALHHVVPTTALVIATGRGNSISNLMGEGFVAVLRHQALHPGQVPGHLEVVTHNATGLVDAPLEIMGPVVEELLVHERAVAVIREVIADGVEGVLKECGVALLTRRQVEIDQISRCVVANGVPVLLGLVHTQ